MTCIQLMRPKHWIKNIIIFIPVFFSGRIFVLLFTGGGQKPVGDVDWVCLLLIHGISRICIQ